MASSILLCQLASSPAYAIMHPMNLPALLATHQLRQREYLLEISRAMTSNLDLPSLLRLILKSAAEMVGCRAGMIALTREEIDLADLRTRDVIFQVRVVYNIGLQYLPAFEPLLHIEALADQGPHGEDGSQLPDLQERVLRVEEQLGATLGQVVGLPLLFENKVLGIIYLFRSEYAFTQMDSQILQGFADQAAIAVRNAQLYEQLNQERNRLAAVIENSANGIVIVDRMLNVLVVNQALTAMVDMTPEEAVGRPLREVLPIEVTEGDDINDAGDLQAFFAEGSRRCEGDLVRPGGGRVSLAVIYTPLYDERGLLVNVIVNVYDITRFRGEEEMKSTFISIISHELKTPVALIKGYAQTLAREDANWDAETARQGLQIIEEEADRLEALINNLLDVSRIQASGLRLDYSDVNIEALLRRLAEAYRTQTQDHTIELDFPHPLPVIVGDEERLRQVFTNLLGNAIKYSPEGGLIRIGGWTEHGPPDQGDEVIIYVADEGVGIPQHELPHIFDRFYRVDSSLRRGTAGTGLGLFLSKAIVEAHRGRIWARSKEGQGTTFFVALPVDGGGEEVI